MKILKVLAIAMLFAIAGIGFMQAEKASNGSCGPHRHLHTRQAKCHTDKNWKTKCRPPKTTCRWDKGYKPKKSKNKPVELTQDDDLMRLLIEPWNANPQKLTLIENSTNNNPQSIMGGNSNTYAPQIFTPVKPFNSPEFIGNYFSGSKVAIIRDVSGQTDQSYVFTDVQSVSGNIYPVGLTQIGSLKDPNFVPSGMYCSGCPNGTINLFGNLKLNDLKA